MQNKLPYTGGAKLNEMSGMPQIDHALSGWGESITLIKITQTITDGDKTETETTVEFIGVDQPLTGQKLMIKPEGQRNFDWRMIHDYYGVLELSVGDKIKRTNGNRYKVDKVMDYRSNGFMEYHIVKDFE